MTTVNPVSSLDQRQTTPLPVDNRSNLSKFVDLIFAPFMALHDWIRPVNPVTQERNFHLIPTAFEKGLGASLYRTIVVKSGGEILETDPNNGLYVTLIREVGEDLAKSCPRKGLSYDFKLINSEIQNAWCLPGGKIGINLGLIKGMEQETSDFGLGKDLTLRDKVAAVLSHEMTHASARHGGRKIEFTLFLYTAIKSVKFAIGLHKDKDLELGYDSLGKLAVGGLNLCSSRAHELEADKFGMHLLAKTPGFNPKALVWLMHYFKKTTPHGPTSTSLFSTHPCHDERLLANEQTFKELKQSESAAPAA